MFEVTDVDHFKATGVQLQDLDCPVSPVVEQWQSWHEARKRGAISDSNGWREIYRFSLAMSFFLGNTVVGKELSNLGQDQGHLPTRKQIQIDAKSSRHPSGASFLDSIFFINKIDTAAQSHHKDAEKQSETPGFR